MSAASSTPNYKANQAETVEDEDLVLTITKLTKDVPGIENVIPELTAIASDGIGRKCLRMVVDKLKVNTTNNTDTLLRAFVSALDSLIPTLTDIVEIGAAMDILEEFQNYL